MDDRGNTEIIQQNGRVLDAVIIAQHVFLKKVVFEYGEIGFLFLPGPCSLPNTKQIRSHMKLNGMVVYPGIPVPVPVL